MPYIGKITDTSGSTGLIGSTLYGTCTTAAATAAKVVTLTDFDTLIDGVTIHVKFTYANGVASPTLNVNGTGAKNIYKSGTTAPGATAATSWPDNSVVSFTYDETASCWYMNDHIDNTNTDTKVNVKLATTTIAYLLATSTTPTNSNQAVESVADTGVYLDTTAGKLTTGSLQSNGDITLYSASGDSPKLVFQRGTLADSNVDWGIGNVGGELYFISRSTGAPENKVIVSSDGIKTDGYYTAATSQGYYLTDSAGKYYAGIFDNGSNLWIGTKSSADYHHKGNTDISTGWSGTLPTSAGQTLTGNPSINICVPTYTSNGNGGGTWSINAYQAIHAGNFTTTGNGNAITSVAFTNNQLTFTKGATFLTELPAHDHAYTVPPEQFAIKTGSSTQSHINLETLMTWLITTKGYITSGARRSLTLYTTWSYSGNDILQLTIGGNNYELHLAGVIIEFEGHATSYNNGVFRLRIHSAPTTNSFTPASGYTRFPLSHIAEYTCNGSGYSPTWKMIIDKDDITTGTTNGTIKVAGVAVSVYGLGSAAYTASTDYLPSTTTYAGSSSVGGAATSANKLNTDAGGFLDPVYFSNGIPVNDSGRSIPYIVGTGSTAGTWLGTLTGLTAYYDGLLILYKPAVAGSSTTTLNINNLGAKTCYIRHTSLLTTHFPANQPILLVYSESQNNGCWMCIDDYWTDSDTYDRNRYKANVKAGTSALVAANIIVGKDGVYNHLNSGGAFDISYPILYNNAAVNASATTNNTYDIINFTITTTQSITLTAYLPVFIKGTLAGSIFTPISTTPLTQTIPTTADGYAYMYLGNATSTTAVYLTERHPIYAYKNGAFGEIVHTASNVNGYTVEKNVPSNAVFTDVSVTAVGNHYAPAEDSSAVISKDASSTTAATWNSTSLVTGIDVKRDAKGHVVDIALDSIKMPANPVPSNNITGSGTTGYLTKFSGTNTITNGPQLGSSTTTFLRNDGTWATPTDTDTKVNVSVKAASDVAYLIGTTTSPNGTAVEGVADTGVYLDSTAGKLTAGSLQSNGNVTLYSASGDSPSLIFQRGTLIDNLNDWKVYVSGGGLYFAQSTANASSETWTNKMYFHASDGNLYVSGTKVSLNGHTHNYAGSDSAGGAATNIATTVTNGTTSLTEYGVVFVADPNVSESNAARKTNDFRVKIQNGTTSSSGRAELCLGNNKSSTTEDNKQGMITLYSKSTSYHSLQVADVSSPVSHTFPATTGTVLNTGTTSYTATVTSGTKIGTIKINNSSTDIYCTDTKSTAGATDTSSKIYLIGATEQTANPQTYSDDQVYVKSGALQVNILYSSTTVCANTANSSTAGGISLYGSDPNVYGIAFRSTTNSGKHGYVQSDWATYFTMNEGGSTRGWVFRRQNYGNIASISGAGNAVFNGSVTVGGNSTNTSGCRMEYNTTTQSLDFVFA